MHRTGRKKNESKKNNQKKKKQKVDLLVQIPTKTPTSTGLACVVCVASVRAGREVRGGGICGDGIRQVFVRTL